MGMKHGRLFAGVLAVACLGTAVGTAVAFVGERPPDPLTRAEVYHKGMTLEQVAEAARGKPGEIAPPCPDVATAQTLKERGIEFGPCDLVPEKGAPVMLAAPENEPAEPEGGVICPAIDVGKDVGLTVTTPCGPGAEISAADVVIVDGEPCADVTYVTERGARSRRETLCEGDTPSAGGEPVRGPSNSDEHRP